MWKCKCKTKYLLLAQNILPQLHGNEDMFPVCEGRWLVTQWLVTQWLVTHWLVTHWL